MRKFGLIGYPLGHSFSPAYFKKKFKALKIKDARYDLYPLKDLMGIKKKLPQDLIGFNVTSPYKNQIIKYLDHLDPVSRKLAAVNTVLIKDGLWSGYNTDVYGFAQSLTQILGRKKKPKRALILGTGGAAKAVAYVLRDLSISYSYVSRKKGYRSYHRLTKEVLAAHKLIINATPLGTAPFETECPEIPYHFLRSTHLLIDLVYNPSTTLFMKKGTKNGANCHNGLEMLRQQADASWGIWNK